MTRRDDIILFYGTNYELVGSWLLRPGTKILLGDPQNRQCRFCGKREPEVSFEDVAHAIPEMLGNKSLSTTYECDACNHLFGEGIENDLGHWSKPLRTLSRIRGKRGVPTLEKDKTGTGWSITYSAAGGFAVTAYEDDPIFEVDEANKSVCFTLKRDPYTPVAVLKAFMKIGLTLLPEEEVEHFPHLLKWVRDRDHGIPFAESCPIIYSFQPGPMPNDLIAAFILRRRDGVANLPYVYLVLAYGNEVFQVQLPSEAKDGAETQTYSVFPFPAPGSPDPDRFGQTKSGLLNLTGRERLRNETLQLGMGFEQVVGGPVQHAESQAL